jgi:uncharacterized protein YxjI
MPLGNVVDHEFKVERGGHQVTEVSKRWFRVRDTYGVEIAPAQDDPLLLAVIVASTRCRMRSLDPFVRFSFSF